MQQHSATPSAAPSTATALPTGGGGGAWELILDKAALEVTNYLSASTKPFDPMGPLSQHMLALLDRSTLLDIVKERNFNQLCGRPGCAELPSGLQAGVGGGATAAREIDFSRWRSTTLGDGGQSVGDDYDDDSDDGSTSSDGSSASPADGEGKVPRRLRRGRTGGRRRSEANADALRELAEMDEETNLSAKYEANHMVKEGNLHLAISDTGEIEYEDDVHIEEAFRLVEREQRLLRQLQRRQQARQVKERAQKQQQQQQQQRQQQALPAVGSRSGMLGATMEERFCSALCLEAFQDELLPLVPHFMEYNHEGLLEAVSSLFPNLRPDTLRQLAELEARRTPIVKDTVVEAKPKDRSGEAAVTDGDGSGLRPIAVGTSNESPLTRKSVEDGGGAPALGTDTPARQCESAQLAESTAAQMGRRDRLWDAAVVYRISRDVFRQDRSGGVAEDDEARRDTSKEQRQALCPVAVPATLPSELLASSRRDSEDAADDGGGAAAALAASLPRARPLRGTLLVIDFLMTVSSNTTKKLFLLHYFRCRRSSCGRNVVDATAAAAPTPPSSAFDRLVAPVKEVLERKADALEAQLDSKGEQALAELLLLEDDLHVDPVVQHQRRELVVSQLFSVDLAAALSRLAWVDVSVITEDAWGRVWFQPSASLITKQKQQRQPAPSKQQAYMTYSLVNSLVFPFAVPSVLLRPLSLSGVSAPPEVVAIGLVMLLAAALCGAGDVRAALRENAEALEEVLFAVDMSDSDATAALRALVLSEED